ncbi:uncharacterized protein LOC135483015 [Lineus longissimus]|uniref:uncharacterized protein LOC135483015 n=1 Tax=Lineus longissimus TaxID=88925 RepID=UPI00315DEDF4
MEMKADDDIDYQKGYVIKAHWKCHDMESDIQRCYYGLGSQPGASNIKSLTDAGPGMESLSVTLKPPLAASTIYVTVRCWNYAGESSAQSSDGVTIVSAPPKADGTVSIITSSISEYPLRGYQSQRDQLELKISGFSDPYGVTVYKVQITGSNIWYSEYQEMQSFGRNEIYVSATGLEMKPGQYSVKTKAENVVGYVSDFVETNFRIDDWHQRSSIVSGGLNKTRQYGSDNSSKVVLNWAEAFTNKDYANANAVNPLQLVYEISIGTTRGGADIIQWQETNREDLIVKIPDSAVKDMFITITAISPDASVANIGPME